MFLLESCNIKNVFNLINFNSFSSFFQCSSDGHEKEKAGKSLHLFFSSYKLHTQDTSLLLVV